MADNRLNEIDELLAKTTPGPWPGDYVYSAVRHIARNCDHIESKTDPDFAWHRYDDAEFIAASRTLVPELLAEVRRLRAENQQFQEELLKAGDAWRESQAENQRLTAEVEHSNEQLTAWAEEAQRADHRADHFQAENMRLRAKIERGSE